jgi:hypothetical protein
MTDTKKHILIGEVMKVIREYRVISNEDCEVFQKEFNKYLQEFQDKGYELDIKFSTCVSINNNLVQSVMILCY